MRRGEEVRVAATDALRLPRFLVLGAQKAGTTWLHQMLRQHPGVFLPDPKELHFFDHRHAYQQGIEWYASHFTDAPANALCGEATANYLWASTYLADTWTNEIYDGSWKYCMPERVLARLGDIPLIVLLREPVARTISAFHHHMRIDGRLDPGAPFQENGRRWGIVHMGLYAAHLERWFEVVARDRVLVLFYEEVMAAPEAALRAVTDHLGLDPFAEPPAQLTERIHAGRRHQGPDGQYYWDEDRTQLAISHGDMAMLRELFEPENEGLARVLGRELAAWDPGRSD